MRSYKKNTSFKASTSKQKIIIPPHKNYQIQPSYLQSKTMIQRAEQFINKINHLYKKPFFLNITFKKHSEHMVECSIHLRNTSLISNYRSRKFNQALYYAGQNMIKRIKVLKGKKQNRFKKAA